MTFEELAGYNEVARVGARSSLPHNRFHRPYINYTLSDAPMIIPGALKHNRLIKQITHERARITQSINNGRGAGGWQRAARNQQWQFGTFSTYHPRCWQILYPMFLCLFIYIGKLINKKNVYEVQGWIITSTRSFRTCRKKEPIWWRINEDFSCTFKYPSLFFTVSYLSRRKLINKGKIIRMNRNTDSFRTLRKFEWRWRWINVFIFL